jgi:hypothetical protein
MLDLWKDFDLSISVDDVLRGQGADPETVRLRRPALVKAAEQALAEGRAKIRPTALVREVPVLEQRHERLLLEGDAVLTGSLVTRHLSGAVRVAAAICTIGSALEIASTRLLGENTVLAMALDGLGNAAVELVGQQTCARIGERAWTDGMGTSTPLNPGAEGWSMEVGGAQIFALLDARLAGIQITSGGMMIPQKTISFVVGIGSGLAQTHPCEVCSLKEICRYHNG